MLYPRLLPILTATLAALGTLLLGMGQREPGLPVLVVLSAGVSVWLTDLAGWFRLHRLVAGGLAIIAFLVALSRAVPISGITSILPIARLLVYLQIILLFQTKQVRIYWQLVVVSLLQVLVAAVFSQGAVFGLLMVVYLFVALAVMTLLFLTSESLQYADGSGAGPRPRAIETAETEGRRWPLADAEPEFVGQIARLPEAPGAGRELAQRIMTMGLGTLCLTAVAFFALPRLGRPAWRSPLSPPRRMVGYSDHVELGSMGSVLQSPDEVARVELIDPTTGRSLHRDEAIYLHGTVLTQYRDRSWTYTESQWPPGPLQRTSGRPVEALLVRERITIEPMNHEDLPYVRPLVVDQTSPDIEFDQRRERLLRAAHRRMERFSYSVETTALSTRRQVDLVPALFRPDEEDLLDVPREAVPSLVRLGERWMAASKLPAERRIERARYLEKQFLQSERFKYSLRAQRTDFQIDPIEDFIANRPEGHCEYFATALALMLRTQGIPSRLIVGFCCDEYNGLGGFYQVRQLHAHTWVEAYIEPGQLPGHLKGNRRWRHGGWLRLDATPGASEGRSSTSGTLLAPIGRGVSWLEFVWNNYVMEMDRARQRKAVYEPLLETLKGVYSDLTDSAWWSELGGKAIRLVDPRNWNVSGWFSWRGGLASVAVGLLLVLLYRLGRWIVRLVRRRVDAARRRRALRRIEIEFFRRMSRLLARQGFRRPPSQTPREFAKAAGRRIAERHGDPDLGGLPLVVVEAYYRVRFGGGPLDNVERLAVEQALERLQAACEVRGAAAAAGKG